MLYLHCWHIFLGKLILCVWYQEAGLPDRPVADNGYFQWSHSVEVEFDKKSLISANHQSADTINSRSADDNSTQGEHSLKIKCNRTRTGKNASYQIGDDNSDDWLIFHIREQLLTFLLEATSFCVYFALIAQLNDDHFHQHHRKCRKMHNRLIEFNYHLLCWPATNVIQSN